MAKYMVKVTEHRVYQVEYLIEAESESVAEYITLRSKALLMEAKSEWGITEYIKVNGIEKISE